MKRIQRVKLTLIKDFAKIVAGQLRGGEILALVGPLGSGKTTFVKALGKQLKIKSRISSPTFSLMHEFKSKIKTPTGLKSIKFYHLDLYRTKNFKEIKALGLLELWGSKNTITVIEWADKIKKHLPKKTYYVYFKH